MSDKPKIEKHVEETLEQKDGRTVVRQKVTEVVERTIPPEDAKVLTQDELHRIDQETARRIREAAAAKRKGGAKEP